MTPGIRRFIASILIVSFLTLPGAMLAKQKRGANITVTRTDGYALRGELIAVKQDSLVLISPAGKDDSVAVADISKVTVAKKSQAGAGFLIGLLAGGIAGGAIGYNNNKGDPDMEGMGAAAGVLLIGGLCGLIGLGIGAAASGDETIEFAALTDAEKSKVLNRLRGMARMPDAQ